jgi:hypothetical protein
LYCPSGQRSLKKLNVGQVGVTSKIKGTTFTIIDIQNKMGQ